MMIRRGMVFATGLWLIGCASGGVVATPEVKPVAYRVEMSVTSDFQDPYQVLAGPNESFGSFAFVARTREALAAYGRTKSQPDATATVVVGVRLVRLETTYGQLGAQVPDPLRGALAMAGPGLVAMGGYGAGGGRPIPDEVSKTAALAVALTVDVPDRGREELEFTVEFEDLIIREDYEVSTLDYASLFDFRTTLIGVRRALVRRVDGEIDRLLQTKDE